MKSITSAKSNQAWIYLFPALLLLTLFLFIPALMSIYYSLTDYNMLAPQARLFIGLKNYLTLFKDPIFLKSVRNVAQFVIFVMPLQVGVALGLALIVNKKRPGNTFFKISFFAPVVVSLVVTSVLWLYILNPEQGLLNGVLNQLGLPSQPLLTSPKQAMFAIIGLSAWQGAGYQMLIFLAGLQNIPNEIYEAATLDGAGKWEKFRHITLPMLKPTSLMILTTTFIDAFKLIVQPMVMTQGGPMDSTITPVYYIYRTGFTDRQLGYASAMTIVYGVAIILFTVIQRKVTGAGGDNDDR
ncbi:multiple sugar abc membrane-spanning permease protein [Lapidilactobacillus concavus DSM 17758]|uniref:Multiple sugar abc membrane-spanning permease protein n=1 Tax=Lapidilactobacillus concavus DSM 17758 TaxID=1423735 RepID=A0A0R1W4X3_9LACO|nr:sugar ABC transporter permease [Lapidilactobacillus concavus]KRM10406.1 multiple sugar abc membrane-spanning permease protein [Lapidilactobacillus concavus DSM 17758]GEL12826.1 ABC transporter permease [Lapidilactobacillus concavus]